MILVNGTPATTIDVEDRGLAYGDGVFETIRVAGGEPVLFSLHMARLERGCRTLGIAAPMREIESDIGSVLPAGGTSDAVVKIIVTRGVSGRGYGPEPDAPPARVVSAAPYWPRTAAWNRGIRAMMCATRLGANPALAGIKHLNRLEQVMAARELTEDCDEGLMRDERGELIEGISSNLFIVEQGRSVTPPVDRCGVAGTMRQFLLDVASAIIDKVTVARLQRADEVFVCNSVYGIRPVIQVTGENENLSWRVGPVTKSLQDRVASETGVNG